MKLMSAINIGKKYKEKVVLSDVSLDIKEGEVIAIIGPNGAGKSTTLDLLTGIKKATFGEIHYYVDNFKKEIGIQLQTTPFFPNMTVIENLVMFSSFYGIQLKKEKIDEILEEFSLKEAAKTIAIKLSGGQQKRLSIAIALVHNPRIIFLDEPTAALDPRARKEVKEMLDQLIKKGKSIILTSHDMEEVSKLATRVIFISSGLIIEDGAPAKLLEKYQVENLEDLYFTLSE